MTTFVDCNLQLRTLTVVPSDNDLAQLATWSEFPDAATLRDTFPMVFRCPSEANARFGLTDAGRLVSHAATREVTLHTGLGERRVLFIGSVATTPERRGQGHATALLQQLLQHAEQDGFDAAMLWSDQWSFYQRLGFQPSGSQWEVTFDDSTPTTAPVAVRQTIRQATLADLPDLLLLHQRKPLRIERDLGEMARLLAAHPMLTMVLEQDGAVAAYACQGKGEDLRNWWHECGGSDEPLQQLLRSVVMPDTALLLPDYRQLDGPVHQAKPGIVALVHTLHRDLGDFFVDGLDSI